MITAKPRRTGTTVATVILRPMDQKPLSVPCVVARRKFMPSIGEFPHFECPYSPAQLFTAGNVAIDFLLNFLLSTCDIRFVNGQIVINPPFPHCRFHAGRLQLEE